MKPLAGIRIIEIASIGPGPFCGMVLADHGAEVIRIEKPGGRDVGTGDFAKDPLLRGRRRVALDLKSADDRNAALSLIAKADGLIEGFRPGVMERLSLGPEDCHAVNKQLVYGRMTGWGQSGPRATTAGHDIDYIALTGALATVGTPESGPVPALNLIGDFGGGGMLLAFGMLAGLLSASRTGDGTVVDAAMVDGSALLMAMTYSLKAQGLWSGGRGDNILDGGAPFYGTYECADGGWMAVGAIEEPFWREFVSKIGLDENLAARRMDKRAWAELREAIGAAFRMEPRSHWEEVFEGDDSCVAPVLSMDEAPNDAHMAARNVFQTVDGVVQPAPAPRFGGAVAKADAVASDFLTVDEVLDNWA